MTTTFSILSTAPLFHSILGKLSFHEQPFFDDLGDEAGGMLKFELRPRGESGSHLNGSSSYK